MGQSETCTKKDEPDHRAARVAITEGTIWFHSLGLSYSLEIAAPVAVAAPPRSPPKQKAPAELQFREICRQDGQHGKGAPYKPCPPRPPAGRSLVERPASIWGLMILRMTARRSMLSDPNTSPAIMPKRIYPQVQAARMEKPGHFRRYRSRGVRKNRLIPRMARESFLPAYRIPTAFPCPPAMRCRAASTRAAGRPLHRVATDDTKKRCCRGTSSGTVAIIGPVAQSTPETPKIIDVFHFMTNEKDHPKETKNQGGTIGEPKGRYCPPDRLIALKQPRKGPRRSPPEARCPPTRRGAPPTVRSTANPGGFWPRSGRDRAPSGGKKNVNARLSRPTAKTAREQAPRRSGARRRGSSS